MQSETNELRSLGLSIKAARESKGLSMRQLAEKAGLSVSTISLLESGQRDVTFSTITGIARALDTKPSVLLDLALALGAELSLAGNFESSSAPSGRNSAS